MSGSMHALNSSLSPFFPVWRQEIERKNILCFADGDASQLGDLLLSGLQEVLGSALAGCHRAVDRGRGAEAGGLAAKEDTAADGLHSREQSQISP